MDDLRTGITNLRLERQIVTTVSYPEESSLKHPLGVF